MHKDKESLEGGDMEEATEEEGIEEEAPEEKGSGETDLLPKAAEFFSASDNFYQRGSGGMYLNGDVVLVRRQWQMDGGIGTQYPTQLTRDQE